MTAVEWLEKELYEKFEIKGDYILYSEILYKAKEIEKQKLIEMHDKGFDSVKQLNDDYAIEFYNFMEDNYYQVADGFVKDLNIDESKRVTITTEKALEIFKKEKGL